MMAKGGFGRDEEGDERKLSHREIWALIWQTYKTVMPRVILFGLLLLLVTFFVTEVLF